MDIKADVRNLIASTSAANKLRRVVIFKDRNRRGQFDYPLDARRIKLDTKPHEVMTDSEWGALVDAARSKWGSDFIGAHRCVSPENTVFYLLFAMIEEPQ